MSESAVPVVLREMVIADIPYVLDVQEPGAVVSLAKVFPQDKFPFPRDAIAQRWADEVASSDVTCFVVLLRNDVVGFAAIRQDEFLHFGVAIAEWGTGVAEAAHNAVLTRMRTNGVHRAWMRVFAENGRGRRFYEKLGWTRTGDTSRSTFPPYAELLRYERDVPRSG